MAWGGALRTGLSTDVFGSSPNLPQSGPEKAPDNRACPSSIKAMLQSTSSRALLLALAVLQVCACSDGGMGSADDAPGTEPTGPSAGPDPEPTQGEPSGRGAAGPGEYLADYATSDLFFTRMNAPAGSGSVHGTVRIWYSSNVEGLAAEEPFVVPEGTVAIKDEYDGSGTVFVKVVMIKKAAGYDPDNGDWYYEARNPDDSVASNPTPGTPSLCIECHRQGASTDYLLGFSIAN